MISLYYLYLCVCFSISLSLSLFLPFSLPSVHIPVHLLLYSIHTCPPLYLVFLPYSTYCYFSVFCFSASRVIIQCLGWIFRTKGSKKARERTLWKKAICEWVYNYIHEVLARTCTHGSHPWHTLSLLMIAFITCKSSLVPLLEGLCTSNPCRFEFSVFVGQ